MSQSYTRHDHHPKTIWMIYYKTYPHWDIRKELGSCTLLLPNNCPIQIVEAQGDGKLLKQLASLEACKLLHRVGELTDNLVPNILEEEADIQESGGESNVDEHAKCFPPELINSCGDGDTVYYCCLLELKQIFQYEVQLQEIMLTVPTRLGYDLEIIDLDLDVDRGKLLVHIRFMEHIF